MTQKEKQLLLKDLCARLPYGVKIATYQYNYCDIITPKGIVGDRCYFNDNPRYDGDCSIDEVKPYLRPMSSITEEEKKELKSATCPKGTGYFDEQYLICPMSHFGEYISYDFMSDILNWLNAHHFDYRGLIEKGLALEAPKDMYKTE